MTKLYTTRELASKLADLRHMTLDEIAGAILDLEERLATLEEILQDAQVAKAAQ